MARDLPRHPYFESRIDPQTGGPVYHAGRPAALAGWAAACLAVLCPAGPAVSDTAVGDAGHYLSFNTRVLVSNPSGGAFRVRLHRFGWWVGGGWNRPDMPVRITGPGGKVVFDKIVEATPAGCPIDVPAGAKGVCAIDVTAPSGLNYWYVTCTLDRAVAWTGRTAGPAEKSRWFFCNPFVPRRWYFWVPKGTRRVVIRAQNSRGRSQREDHGLTVISPRGQRLAVLWGQAAADDEPVTTGGAERRMQVARVLVEPGAAGRFWAIEVRQGDSHTYSDVNFSLDGVPPYVARSPEEWFDPNTGRPAPVEPYDQSHFVQSDPPTDVKKRLIQHWTPCPALGDPDGCELRCPARIALWNPAGRALKFVIGTYLPRNMFPPSGEGGKGPRPRLPDEQLDHADVTITGPGGQTILKDRAPLKHLHDPRHGRYEKPLRTPKGVLLIDVTGAEHFWAYTYPATPAVMVARPAEGGWKRFSFDAGTARNWYFHVPRGTKEFSVRASAADSTDVMHLEINAPDRTLAVVYGNAGRKTVTVPPGLDGKIWHVRLDFGSATRFASQAARPRFPSMNVTLDLKGVPGCLAPTWEQWFDPNQPRAPHER
ncbi:MAG: hypothetical protein WBF17_09125 [Phycisphaerae bacterium]